MKKKVLFISAADRWNLGDLLFPIVFKHFAETKGLEFCNTGIRAYESNDLELLPVLDIREFRRHKNILLIIGGGEVLNVNIGMLKYYLESRNGFHRFSDAIISRLQRGSFLDRNLRRLRIIFWQAQYGILSLRIVSFYNNILRDSDRFYLPVGGKFNENGKRGRKILSNTRMIAGRDQRTHESFPVELNAGLSPDPVSVIRTVFPVPKEKKKQLVVQFSGPGAFSPEQLAKLISSFISNGLKVIGLAIGRCNGHDDIESLRNMKKRIPHMDVVESETIGQSVEILASSTVYMGTSLHGAIIAHAYGNAVIGLAERVPKLKNYISTWMSEYAFNYQASSTVSDLTSFVERFDSKKAQINADALAAKAEEYTVSLIDHVLLDLHESL